MKLIDICKRPVVSIDHAAPLRDAARLMRRHHVGALVVTRGRQGVGAGLEIVGMVTDRDLAVEALARDLDPTVVTVGGIASEQVVGVPAEAGIEDAVLRMQGAGVRRLVVHTAAGELAGIVSFDDLFGASASLLSGLAAVLQRGLEREAGLRPDVEAPPPLRIPAIGTMGWHPGDRIAATV
jgi:CBS domain-containing protein